MERYRLNECIQESKLKNIRVACVPEKTMPAIFGALHPIIVLSEEIVYCKEINFIIRHEMQHYHNYDLHLKVILDLLVMIHWWNPFIYGLRKELNTAIEFSNDYMVSKGMNSKEKIQYAESLLSIAKMQMRNGEYDLALIGSSYMEERIHLLIDVDFITEKKKKISTMLNALFLIMVMFTAFIFVPEAEYLSEAEKVFGEEEVFSINADNSYFIMNSEGYKLYVSGEYVTVFQEIPIDLAEVPIYEEKDNK